MVVHANKTNDRQIPKDEAFFQLFMGSQKNLFAYILACVHNYADTNDILQETATVMWRKFDTFDRSTCFVAWGIAIARNNIRSYYASKKNNRLQFSEKVMQMIDTAAVNDLPETQHRLIALQKCYDQLSESNRVILKLRYHSGLTIKTIANRLDKPIQGMYKRLSRLHDSLLQCIEKKMAVSEELS